MPENTIACGTAGRVARIAAPVGHIVAVGDPILVLASAGADEIVDAPVAGRVKALFFEANDTVPEAALVAIIES